MKFLCWKPGFELKKHLKSALSNARYTSPTILDEIISCCDFLVQKCNLAGMLGVMADESANIKAGFH